MYYVNSYGLLFSFDGTMFPPEFLSEGYLFPAKEDAAEWQYTAYSPEDLPAYDREMVSVTYLEAGVYRVQVSSSSFAISFNCPSVLLSVLSESEHLLDVMIGLENISDWYWVHTPDGYMLKVCYEVSPEVLKQGGCKLFSTGEELREYVKETQGLEDEEALSVLDIHCIKECDVTGYWVEICDRGIVSDVELEEGQTIEDYIINWEI